MAWVTMTYLDTSGKTPVEYDVLFNTDKIVKITPNANRVSATLHYDNSQTTAIVMHPLDVVQERLTTHHVETSKPKSAVVSTVATPLNPEPAPRSFLPSKAKGTTSSALE